MNLKKAIVVLLIFTISMISLGTELISVNTYGATEEITTSNVVKTKEDLKVLLDKYDQDFINTTLHKYATQTASQFLDDLSFGTKVYEDTDSDATDYTVAFYMIDALSKNLCIYSESELKSLCEICKKKYNTNNILNENLGDYIYNPIYYQAFATEYEKSTEINSSDSLAITNAYELLNASLNKIITNELTTVTRSDLSKL